MGIESTVAGVDAIAAGVVELVAQTAVAKVEAIRALAVAAQSAPTKQVGSMALVIIAMIWKGLSRRTSWRLAWHTHLEQCQSLTRRRSWALMAARTALC